MISFSLTSRPCDDITTNNQTVEHKGTVEYVISPQSVGDSWFRFGGTNLNGTSSGYLRFRDFTLMFFWPFGVRWDFTPCFSFSVGHSGSRLRLYTMLFLLSSVCVCLCLCRFVRRGSLLVLAQGHMLCRLWRCLGSPERRLQPKSGFGVVQVGGFISFRARSTFCAHGTLSPSTGNWGGPRCACNQATHPPGDALKLHHVWVQTLFLMFFLVFLAQAGPSLPLVVLTLLGILRTLVVMGSALVWD